MKCALHDCNPEKSFAKLTQNPLMSFKLQAKKTSYEMFEMGHKNSSMILRAKMILLIVIHTLRLTIKCKTEAKLRLAKTCTML